MFQTDLNHWLQSWDWAPWTAFMKFVSFFGNTYPVMLICLLIISMVHLRKGWILLNIVAMTAIFTNWMKETIDYPRPLAIDVQLQSFGDEQTKIDLTHLAPTSFTDLFNQQLLDQTRQSDIGRFGFPSGHTSIMVAICIGFAAVFRSRNGWFFGALFVLLTMLSRLYLGVHYLGDVIGGLLLGSLITYLVYQIGHYWLNLEHQLHLLLFAMLPLFPLVLLEKGGNWQTGLILGTNISLFLQWKYHEYILSPSIKNRLMNFITLVLLFLGSFILVKTSTSNFPDMLETLLITLSSFASITLHFLLAKRLGWVTKT